MLSHPFSTKILPELTEIRILSDIPQGNLIQNTNISINENAYDNAVCKMVAILLRPPYIKLCKLDHVVSRAQIQSLVPLTLKHRETHGCVVSTVATDALVLKHQAISIHNAD